MHVTLVSPTPKGEAVVRELQVAVAATINDILGPMTDREEGDLKRLLRRALS